MKDPMITVAASDELLRALHAADLALKASRSRQKPSLAPLHALIVQVAAARMRLMALEAPAGGLD